MKRRQVLSLASLAPALLPSGLDAAPTASGLSRYRHGAADNWLLVDGRVDTFAGEGVYLFPAWGRPRAYRVRVAPRQPASLAFHDLEDDRLLWTQSALLEHGFAGLVHAELPAARAGEAESLSLLSVPRLPLGA